MSSTKRRKLDADTASNASGGGGGRNAGSGNNAGSNASGRRGGGGPGSRGGHSAATASRAAAAASAVNSASSGINAPASVQAAAQPYVPVLPLSSLPVSALSKYALHYGLVPPEPLTVAQATFPTPALPLTLKLADSYTVPAQRGRTSTVEGRRNRSPFVSARGTHQPSPSTSSVQPAAAVRGSAGEQRSEEQSDAGPSSSSRLPVNAVVNGDGGASGASSANSASTPVNTVGNSRSSSNQGTPHHDQHVLYGQSAEWSEPGEADAQELRGMTAFEGGEEQLKDRLGSLARTHWDKLAAIKEAETVVNFAYAIRMRSKILKSAPMV